MHIPNIRRKISREEAPLRQPQRQSVRQETWVLADIATGQSMEEIVS